MAFFQIDPFSHPSGGTTASPHESSLHQSRIVAIGTSAGGLNAVSVILSALPASFPAPILVVQHLSPEFPSRLASILSSLTDLRVKEAAEGDCLQPGHVYVAPPGKHLLVNPNQFLSLSLSAKVHHCRPSVDVLFRSVATTFGSRAIGVVLTGGDGDGASGIQGIKAMGGITIAQDLLSSQQPSMPRHAAATGDVDFVVPLPDIAALLMTLVNPGSAPVPSPLTDAEAKTDAEVKLAECSEALRVAEEALRVQSEVSRSYRTSRRSAPHRNRIDPHKHEFRSTNPGKNQHQVKDHQEP
ncbi:MAG: chemotaxis protein CheB [Janthinobacterium lividum]